MGTKETGRTKAFVVSGFVGVWKSSGSGAFAFALFSPPSLGLDAFRILFLGFTSVQERVG